MHLRINTLSDATASYPANEAPAQKLLSKLHKYYI